MANSMYVQFFNEMIGHGKKVGIYPVHEMHGLGTPGDLREFEDWLYE